MNDLTKNFKDVAYVLIGLGVVSFQQAQAQTDALRKRAASRRLELDKQLAETRSKLTDLAKDVENRIEPVREQLESRIEGRLATLRGRINRAA